MSISTSNHMFGRATWDKLPKCIFEKCPSKTRAVSKVSKIKKMIYTKNLPSQTSDYWLITPN